MELLFVYTEYINARIEYAFNFVLNTLCGFAYTITTDRLAYQQYNGPSLNYSGCTLKEKDIVILPNGLLHQSKIVRCHATIDTRSTPNELLLSGDDVQNHFDVFASSFYLISRYEEYTNFHPDVHGRFDPRHSILFQNNLLQFPVVDAWAVELKEKILNQYPWLSSKKKEFKANITIDVDQAFAFSNRGGIRNILSFSKNLATLNFPFLKSQVETYIQKKRDAFDTFSYLKSVQEESKLPFIYFFNVGLTTKFDKNISTKVKAFANLIKSINRYAEIGVHPSYFSNEKPELLGEEKNRISAITGEEIHKSRQHFLKFTLPDTYINLIKYGIKEDYSMGYASLPGFRSGTCTPFYWFDLGKNRATLLKLFPITFMEGTLAEYKKLKPDEAMQVIQQLTATVKKHNGVYISIWHNHTVNDQFKWKGWKTVFERSIDMIKNG